MKEKLQYSIVLTAILTGAYLSLKQLSETELIPEDAKRAEVVNTNNAPSHVKPLIEKLKKKYSHVNDECIYGTAMVISDLANEVSSLLDTEAKCIHTMVIEESKTLEEAKQRLAYNNDKN